MRLVDGICPAHRYRTYVTPPGPICPPEMVRNREPKRAFWRKKKSDLPQTRKVALRWMQGTESRRFDRLPTELNPCIRPMQD